MANDDGTDTGLDSGPDSEPMEAVSDPVGTARRKHGTAGAVLAAGLFGVDIALGRKPKEEIPVVVDAAGEPTDVDQHGIRIPIDDDTHVVAPALPRSEPMAARPRRKRGWGRSSPA